MRAYLLAVVTVMVTLLRVTWAQETEDPQALNAEARKAFDKEDYERAESLYTRALQMGAHDRAKSTYQRNLEILAKAVGTPSPADAHDKWPLCMRAKLLGGLGRLYQREGKADNALSSLQRAVQAAESAGECNFLEAVLLAKIAGIYRIRGFSNQATSLTKRVVELSRRFNSDFDSHFLANMFVAQGDTAGARSVSRQSLGRSEQRLRRVSVGSTDSRMALFLRVLRDDEERAYSLASMWPADLVAQRLALAYALLRKGRALDETTSLSRVISQELKRPEDGRLSGVARPPTPGDLFEQLRMVRSRLATLYIRGGQDERSRQTISQLEQEGEKLEHDLVEISARFRARTSIPGPGEIIDRVAGALPRNGALIEIVEYRPYHFELEDRPW